MLTNTQTGGSNSDIGGSGCVGECDGCASFATAAGAAVCGGGGGGGGVMVVLGT